MTNWWDRLVPKRLGNRLFLAFIVLILLPLLLFQFYQYFSLRKLMSEGMAEKSYQQTVFVKSAVQDLRAGAYESYLLLERSTLPAEALSDLDEEGQRSFQGLLTEWFQKRVGVKPYLRHVKVMMADTRKAMYRWNTADPVEFPAFVGNPSFLELEDEGVDARWMQNGRSLYSVYRTSREAGPYLWLSQTPDYEALLFEIAMGHPLQQFYYLLDGGGQVIASTGRASTFQEHAGGYITHKVELPGDGLTLVSQLPLDQYFGDLDKLQRQSLLTLLMVALLFSMITYFTASAITRPLSLLQRKMSEVVSKQFNTKLPLDKYRGEFRDLAQSFNGMVTDLQDAVLKLKREERQREAIRFQMLMSQMNPHFLLNTLNTIKWNVTDKNDQETAEICVALGRLLEASLSEEADLIFLRNELELVQAYAHIQNFRYDQRFKVTIEHSEELVYALVPKLSLQPLVENCIVHGLQFMKSGGEIRIRIYQEEKSLILEVDDNGIGLQEASKLPRMSKRKGIGVSNLRERLQLLFRQEASLELLSLRQGTRARLSIPFLYSKPYTEE